MGRHGEERETLMRVIVGGVWGEVGAQQGREHPGCTPCLHAQPSRAGRYAWRKARRCCQPPGTAGWGPPGGLGGDQQPHSSCRQGHGTSCATPRAAATARTPLSDPSLAPVNPPSMATSPQDSMWWVQVSNPPKSWHLSL